MVEVKTEPVDEESQETDMGEEDEKEEKSSVESDVTEIASPIRLQNVQLRSTQPIVLLKNLSVTDIFEATGELYTNCNTSNTPKRKQWAENNEQTQKRPRCNPPKSVQVNNVDGNQTEQEPLNSSIFVSSSYQKMMEKVAENELKCTEQRIELERELLRKKMILVDLKIRKENLKLKLIQQQT